MPKATLFRNLLLLAAGAVLGGVVVVQWEHVVRPAAAAQARANTTPDLAALQADVNHLKEVVPSQSHAMADVGFHWASLWFAAEKKNWPLATFYFDEAHQHVLWTIRIRPIRKDPAGNDVDLKGIFDGIDKTVWSTVKQAIEKKDSVKFVAAYKQTLETCYACHKSSGKPYLRPTIPRSLPQPIINVDPDATWPQ